MLDKQPGDIFEWKDVQFVVINKPVGRVACNYCDLWVGGYCIADENTPPCLNRGIAFKTLDNKKLKKLTTKNK